jgi:hypothetical protein
MSLLALAKFRAQFIQYTRGAGQVGAADFQPLELGQKIAACQRRQPLQIILNPIGLNHGMRFPHLIVSAIARRAQALPRARAAKQPRKAGRRKFRNKFSARETTVRRVFVTPKRDKIHAAGVTTPRVRHRSPLLRSILF